MTLFQMKLFYINITLQHLKVLFFCLCIIYMIFFFYPNAPVSHLTNIIVKVFFQSQTNLVSMETEGTIQEKR